MNPASRALYFVILVFGIREIYIFCDGVPEVASVSYLCLFAIDSKELHGFRLKFIIEMNCFYKMSEFLSGLLHIWDAQKQISVH
jgi:hypothetical protein